MLCILCCVLSSVSDASVDLFLAPTRAATIQGSYVTYNMYVRSDVDTRLEALGDIFLVYDKNCLHLITANVVDLATQIKWTDRILDLGYKGPLYAVTGNTGVIRFAKISLHERFFLTANVPVEILRIPFEIIPSVSFTITRLYFPRALMIDDHHKNVLRNAADSFLIKQGPVKAKNVKKYKKR